VTKFKTTVLLQIKHWTVWYVWSPFCIIIYTSYKLIKMVCFFCMVHLVEVSGDSIFSAAVKFFFKTCVAVKLVADDDYDVLISVSVLDQQVLSWSWSCNRHFLVLINKSCHGLDLATITSWSWSTSPVMVLILQPSLLGLGSTSPVMVLILQPSLGLGLFLHPGLDRSQCNTICIVKVKKLISYKLNEKWNEAVFQQ